jgi:undecaprenyl-diphosphatase
MTEYTAIGMIEHFDVLLFHAVNSWCGNWTLDRLAAFEESNQFFKGGLLLAAYWWFWFAGRNPEREATRRRIIAVLIGVFLGLALARTLAVLLPFRVRPMYVDGIGYHSPSLQFPMDMESWSSFPSDMATYFFGLAFGLYGLSRRVGVFFLVFSAVWVCLPRLYLGIHYPSDLVGGALLGVGVVFATTTIFTIRGGALGQRIMQPIALLEQRRPQVFYAAAFAISFEMANIFDDVRDLLRAALHEAHAGGYSAIGKEGVLLLICGLSATLAGLGLLVASRRRHGSGSAPHRKLNNSPIPTSGRIRS